MSEGKRGFAQRIVVRVMSPARVKALAALLRKTLSPEQFLAIRRRFGGQLKAMSPGLSLTSDLELRPFEKRSVPDLSLPGDSDQVGPLIFGGRSHSEFADLKAIISDLAGSVVVACAFQGRHRTLEASVKEASAAAGDGHTVTWCLVGTEPPDAVFLESLTAAHPNVVGLMLPNQPAGWRWQAAVDLARRACDFELLAITGSDDVLPHGLISGIVARHRQHVGNDPTGTLAPGLYATMQWLVLGAISELTGGPYLVKSSNRTGKSGVPLGVGRFYSRAMIDRCEGNIFESKRSRQLSDKGFHQTAAMGMGIDYYTVAEGAVLSVRGTGARLDGVDGTGDVATVEFSFEGSGILSRQLATTSVKELLEIASGS